MLSNSFDLKNAQNVTDKSQPIGWIFSHVKVNFVFKQYLYQMGNFKIQPVEVSPEAQLYSFQGDEEESSEIEPYSGKLTRADYAVKDSQDKVEGKRFMSMTEMAQNFLREQSEDSEPHYSGGESTQTSDDIDHPSIEPAQIK